MKQCPKCNFKTARNDDKFCAICGESLETVAGISVCSSCGAELFPHARFCTRCGTQPSSFGPTLSTARDQSSETSISVKAGENLPPKRADISRVQVVKPAQGIRKPPEPSADAGRELNADEPAGSIDTKSDTPAQTEWTTEVFVDPPSHTETPPTVFINGTKVISPRRILSRDEIRALGIQALKVIPERVAFFAPLVGVKYGRITVRNYRSQWAACSARDGNMDFNCLLMLAPPEVLDSVVVHELCHILEPGHTEQFYAEVLRVFPNYWKNDKWLEDHSFMLDNMESDYVYQATAKSVR